MRASKSISAEAQLQTPLGELTSLTRPRSWNKEDILLREGKGCREKKGGEGGEGRDKRGERGVQNRARGVEEKGGKGEGKREKGRDGRERECREPRVYFYFFLRMAYVSRHLCSITHTEELSCF